MASELTALINQRDEARAALEKMDDAIAEHQSPGALEQRELARGEYIVAFFRGMPPDAPIWSDIAKLAERSGEAWLFNPDEIQSDRELAAMHAKQASQS